MIFYPHYDKKESNVSAIQRSINPIANHMKKNTIILIVLAVIVVAGIYFWQKNKKAEPVDETLSTEAPAATEEAGEPTETEAAE